MYARRVRVRYEPIIVASNLNNGFNASRPKKRYAASAFSSICEEKKQNAQISTRTRSVWASRVFFALLRVCLVRWCMVECWNVLVARCLVSIKTLIMQLAFRALRFVFAFLSQHFAICARSPLPSWPFFGDVEGPLVLIMVIFTPRREIVVDEMITREARGLAACFAQSNCCRIAIVCF